MRNRVFPVIILAILLVLLLILLLSGSLIAFRDNIVQLLANISTAVSFVPQRFWFAVIIIFLILVVTPDLSPRGQTKDRPVKSGEKYYPTEARIRRIEHSINFASRGSAYSAKYLGRELYRIRILSRGDNIIKASRYERDLKNKELPREFLDFHELVDSRSRKRSFMKLKKEDARIRARIDALVKSMEDKDI